MTGTTIALLLISALILDAIKYDPWAVIALRGIAMLMSWSAWFGPYQKL